MTVRYYCLMTLPITMRVSVDTYDVRLYPMHRESEMPARASAISAPRSVTNQSHSRDKL